MKLRHLFYILALILATSNIFSIYQSDESFKFLNFYIDNSSQTNKVSFEVTQSDEYKKGDIFQLQIFYNNELVDETCQKELNTDNSVLFTKFVCDVEKLGDGEYKFIGKIIRGQDELKSISSKHYLLKDVEANLEIDNSQNNKTIVYITVSQTGKNLVIQNTIPKSVIENLDDTNKDQLITSDFKYKILQKDPLIAWTVDKAPVKINYTINKRVTNEQLQDFSVKVEEESIYVRNAKYFLSLVIIGIIVLVFKPLFSRSRK